MDLRVRTILHSNLQRPPLLLCHVRALQRRRPSLRSNVPVLALLDVLRQPIHLLDRRYHRRYPPLYPSGMRLGRSCLLQTPSWLDMLILRFCIRHSNRSGISHQPKRNGSTLR